MYNKVAIEIYTFDRSFMLSGVVEAIDCCCESKIAICKVGSAHHKGFNRSLAILTRAIHASNR